MNPLAMAESAANALNSYKKMLDEAKKTFESAKKLRDAINMFEVTVAMIPQRGNHMKLQSKSVTIFLLN